MPDPVDRDLRAVLTRRGYSRRQILRRAAVVGLATPAVASLLAACGGSDNAEPTATTASGGTTAQPTSSTGGSSQATAQTSTAASPTTAAAATKPASQAATPAKAAVPDATLTLGLSVDISNLDPHIYKGSIDLLVDNLVYDTLIDQDPVSGELIPRLAQSWENVDNTTVHFKLRPNVVFSDGTPCDAAAVKKSFDRNRQAVKGKTFYNTIADITVIDPTTVQFKLSQPYAPLLTNLTVSVGGVLSPKIVDKNSVDGVADVIGTGPFILTKWTPQQELVLERNTKYWGTKALLAKVNLKIITDESTRLLSLKSGSVDGIMNPPITEVSNLKKDPKVTTILSPQSRLVWVGFNFQNEILGKNLKLRQAVAHGIDAKSIVDLALEGIPRLADQGPIPPEILPTKPPIAFQYDQKMAKQLLSDAGYPNGIKLELWSPDGRYFGDKAIAEVSQQQLQQVGFQIELKVLEWGALQDAYTNHQQQLFVLGWGYGASADSALSRIFKTGSNVNWSGYSNPALDKALDEASQIFDRQKQIEAYSAISKMLMDDVVVVPIYYAVNVWATSSKVHELLVSPQEVIYLDKTWIEK